MCNKPINAAEGMYYIVDGEPYCKKDYIANAVCNGCGMLIMQGKILQTPNGEPFHPECLKCSSCDKRLEGARSMTDTKERIQCIQCFHRKYSPKCAFCEKPIVYEESKSCIKVEDTGDYYHIKCYKCSDCGLKLSSDIPGMECYPLNDRPYCKTCHIDKKKAYGLDRL